MAGIEASMLVDGVEKPFSYEQQLALGHAGFPVGMFLLEGFK